MLLPVAPPAQVLRREPSGLPYNGDDGDGDNDREANDIESNVAGGPLRVRKKLRIKYVIDYLKFVGAISNPDGVELIGFTIIATWCAPLGRDDGCASKPARRQDQLANRAFRLAFYKYCRQANSAPNTVDQL
ncbi:hypothetical protein G5I_00156 [Acromyrmex echinatior]|uniref:Uncharacterized protein n=1 Tax=Acromyrmex echinatior TaxID=103372 RepID=F4W451_ACREC|nr:hypothetical protein G5I_00156 [Acromyrmex echinatior]